MDILAFLKQKIFGKKPETVADGYYKKMDAIYLSDILSGKVYDRKNIEDVVTSLSVADTILTCHILGEKYKDKHIYKITKIVWDYTGKPTGIKGIERLGEQLKEIS